MAKKKSSSQLLHATLLTLGLLLLGVMGFSLYTLHSETAVEGVATTSAQPGRQFPPPIAYPKLTCEQCKQFAGINKKTTGKVGLCFVNNGPQSSAYCTNISSSYSNFYTTCVICGVAVTPTVMPTPITTPFLSPTPHTFQTFAPPSH